MKTAGAAILLCVAMLGLASGIASAAEPRIRVAIEDRQPVLVGQQIRVTVTVLVPNFFLSSPQFPVFDIPGAVVTLLDESGSNSTETIDGNTYAGITRNYAVTPQRAGDFSLPPAEIAFRYAAEPGKPGVAASVTLPSHTFTARLPEGAPAGSAALVAKVVVTQTLDRSPTDLKAGDALTRTVETFAANTRAMMIPPPEFEAPQGVRLYPRDPDVTDVISDRGVFTGGRRIDRITCVFEQPGDYVLPAIEIPWFNAETGKQEISIAPAVHVSVSPAPAPASGSDLAPPAPKTAPAAELGGKDAWRAVAWLLGLIAAAAVIWILLRIGAHAPTWMQARQQAQQASATATFARLRQACLRNDAPAAYRELRAWAPRQGFATLRDARDREPMLDRQTAALEQCLFGPLPAAPWNGRALLESVQSARTLRHATRRAGNCSMLPALNPY